MNGRMVSPQEQRRFALEVVGRLRQAGFEAYWAGGCVRDELLGRVPKDYDVATSATPPEIRDLFGHRRTLALGAAFGVITVKGPRKAGMVEVATFRRDAAYSDGRHPDHVTFSSAREDAARRDFTINGLFFDPLRQQVIDFVGGREDLARRVIRAIGQPARRMAEDKLRLLRAVRFAAAFDFALDEDTAATIRAMAAQIAVVSPERIAMEMRRMLMERGRARAVGLLLETGLAAALLPEIVHTDPNAQQRLDRALAVLDRLDEPGFPLALAALLDSMVESSAARAICLRWRLSNKETDRVAWLIAHRSALAGAPAMRHSQLQPLLLAEGIEDLLVLHELSGPPGPEDAAFCRALLAGPRDRLDPPPLLSGDDLLAAGLPSGPRYKTALRRIRAAQLD
ncbi:MAG: CCA tRNA nucleotidyltransferase, partial [Thermoguttaceae bacterium]